MQSLQPALDSNSYIQGDVTIEPGVVIAPGVLLQAGPNSRIIIGAGACLGMGVILQAHEGTLEIEAGASLGAGVLVFGSGKIGSNACIGTTSTLLNPSIEPSQVIAPGSLIGEMGTGNGSSATQVAQVVQPAPNQPQPLLSGPPVLGSPNPRENVPGAAYLNRLRSTLFPHEQTLKQPPQ